jgi:aldose 1-epimerase
VRVRYELDGAALRIACRATTDAPTVVSLASHAYWNLDDGGASAIRDHALWIARRSTRRSTRTGSRPVASRRSPAPFDFTTEPDRRAHRALIAERSSTTTTSLASAATSRSRRASAQRGRRAISLHHAAGLQLYGGNCFDGTQRLLQCHAALRRRRAQASTFERPQRRASRRRGCCPAALRHHRVRLRA